MLRILNLDRAGYPFEADDLTLEEWFDLGRFKEQLKQPDQSTELIKALFGTGNG